jgi:hypothetical protein
MCLWRSAFLFDQFLVLFFFWTGVQALVDANGYSLSDVVKEVAAAVTTEPGTCIVDTALCVAALADIQHRLSGSCSDRLQMAAIVAAVQTRAAQ